VTKVAVFYHKDDLDGLCSGAIARLAYEGMNKQVLMFPVSYGDSIDFAELRGVEEIAILDFSFPRLTMESLLSVAPVTWIDHHKSALLKLSDLPFENLVVANNRAACELAFSFYFRETVPWFVTALGMYDTWRFKEASKEEIMILQFGARFYATDPDENIHWWEKAIRASTMTTLDQIKRAGEILYKHAIQGAEIKAKRSTLGTMGPFRVALVNDYDSLIAEVFQSANKELFEKASFLVMYRAIGDRWMFSLRLLKDRSLDLSKIAKDYQGGGHPGAAGFTIPFSTPLGNIFQLETDEVSHEEE